MNNREVAIEIMRLARTYADNLEGRNVMFVYRDHSTKPGKTEFIETQYKAENFIHLTGVYINIPHFTPIEFYNKALSGELQAHEFRQGKSPKQPPTRQDITTIEKKLQAAEQTLEIHKRAVYLGDWNGDGYKFYTQKLAGTIGVCMGYVRTNAKTGDTVLYSPNSNQLVDIRSYITHQNPILLTMRKPIGEAFYSEITRLNRTVSLDTFKLPDNIVAKLSDKAKIALNQPTEKEMDKQAVKADEKSTETQTDEKEADKQTDELAAQPPTRENIDVSENSYVLELDDDEEQETDKETEDDIDLDDDDDLEL